MKKNKVYGFMRIVVRILLVGISMVSEAGRNCHAESVKEFTEQEIIKLALDQNHLIAAGKLNARSDSILLLQHNAYWFPEFSVRAPYSFMFHDSIKTGNTYYKSLAKDTNRVYQRTELEFGAVQRVPGGGKFSTALNNQAFVFHKNDSLSTDAAVSLIYEQSLLKNGPFFDSISLAKKILIGDTCMRSLQRMLYQDSFIVVIRNIYWETVLKRIEIELNFQELQRAEEMVHYVQERLRIDNITKIDSINAVLEMLDAKQVYEDNVNQYKILLKQLTTLCRVPISVPAYTIDSVCLGDIKKVDILVGTALLNNRQLRYDSLRIENSVILGKMLKNSMVPELSARVFYNSRNLGDELLSGDYKRNEFGAGFIFTYFFPSRVKKLEQKKLSIEKEVVKRIQLHTKENIEIEVEQLYLSYDRGKNKLNLLKESSNLAKLQLFSDEQRYQHGIIGMYELLDSKRKFLVVHRSLIETLLMLKMLEVNLDFLTGKGFEAHATQ